MQDLFDDVLPHGYSVHRLTEAGQKGECLTAEQLEAISLENVLVMPSS